MWYQRSHQDALSLISWDSPNVTNSVGWPWRYNQACWTMSPAWPCSSSSLLCWKLLRVRPDPPSTLLYSALGPEADLLPFGIWLFRPVRGSEHRGTGSAGYASSGSSLQGPRRLATGDGHGPHSRPLPRAHRCPPPSALRPPSSRLLALRSCTLPLASVSPAHTSPNSPFINFTSRHPL